MREAKSKVKEKLRRRLFRERQFRSNLILAPVKARLRDEQQLRTVARVEYYNNLAKLQSAREYDLDFEEQGLIDNSSTLNRARSSSCGACGVIWYTCSISNYSAGRLVDYHSSHLSIRMMNMDITSKSAYKLLQQLESTVLSL